MESIVDTKQSHKVLILGIGRSNVIDILYSNGFKEITAIDISPLLIAQMQDKYRNFPGVECKIFFFFFFHQIFILFLYFFHLIVYVMDARELHQFQNNTFSLIIDKGLSINDSLFICHQEGF